MEQDRALRVLEFTKIRERLAAHALTDMGKEKCLALAPYDDLSEVRRALDETEEACVLITYLGGQPLVGFPDVREQVTLAQKGACLSPRALLDVAACLRATRAAFISRTKVLAVPPAAWKAVKSCRPTSARAARSMAASSRRTGQCALNLP